MQALKRLFDKTLLLMLAYNMRIFIIYFLGSLGSGSGLFLSGSISGRLSDSSSGLQGGTRGSLSGLLRSISGPFEGSLGKQGSLGIWDFIVAPINKIAMALYGNFII